MKFIEVDIRNKTAGEPSTQKAKTTLYHEVKIFGTLYCLAVFT